MKNKVLIVQNKHICDLNISPKECVSWVNESFCMKYEAQLPAKISVHPQGNDFFTSMPALLPQPYRFFGVKEVCRINGREPALSSDILLYDSITGDSRPELPEFMPYITEERDENYQYGCKPYICNMRTGAVAALSIDKLKKSDAHTFSFIGLGNTARATAMCLLSLYANKDVKFRLLRYKDQADSFIERFQEYTNALFEIVDTVQELISGAEIIISCITDASDLICTDNTLYNKGVLLVPVHTRGFQNCDLFFDKIYGDDRGHVCGFKNFSKFRAFDEFSNVLLSRNPGRENDKERIIAYNIGLGLHDILFACKIYERLNKAQFPFFMQEKETAKFWI